MINFPFAYRGSTSVNTINTATESGFYSIREASSNIAGWTAYGTILVYNTGSNYFITQIFVHSEVLLAFRTSSNQGDTWQGWKKIELSQ